jgi:hypothetical protein
MAGSLWQLVWPTGFYWHDESHGQLSDVYRGAAVERI